MRRRAFVSSLLRKPTPRRFLFRVRGTSGLYIAPDTKLGRMNADGSGFEIIDFGRPHETGFGVQGFFRDGRRALLVSHETNPAWQSDPFQQYKQSRSHCYIWELRSRRLTEILTQQRLAPFYTAGLLLPGEERITVSVLREKEQLYVMNLDGTGQVAITEPHEYTYGTSLSPDGKRLAFHSNYQIYTAGIDGTGRTKVAGGTRGLLYFSTAWSPDGEWLVYLVCDTQAEPGHDWSGIWIGRPNGSENRPLTQGGAALFDAAHGARGHGAGGSNLPKWAPDGSGILYSRRRPGSKLPWEFNPKPARDDHFNRVFKPELARGGTQLVLVNTRSGEEQVLTQGPWDFRGEWSPDGRHILFCRAETGGNAALWVMDPNGRNQRKLTQGVAGRGVDHPRWIPGTN